MDVVVLDMNFSPGITTGWEGIHWFKTIRELDPSVHVLMNTAYGDIKTAVLAMKPVLKIIEKVAPTDAIVLILGENGTGKEIVAWEIQRNSLLKDSQFVKVDLGSFAETLFESELFGHISEAFTDARKSRTGRFEIASGGNLFPDEIGNLDVVMQAKLLTVLQSAEQRIPKHGPGC